MDTSAQSKFGFNVRKLRQQRGFTQEGFAQHASLDRAFYGRIERGKQNVSLKTIWGLSAHLGTEPQALFSGIAIEDCSDGEGG